MSCVKEETRSVSPHCPKPNESEEPLGTAMEETLPGNSAASVKAENAVSEVVITKEMEEEEMQLVEKGEKKEEEIMKKAREAQRKETHDIRFKRLQHLLDKSNIYSKFLLTKMEQQQQEVSRIPSIVSISDLSFFVFSVEKNKRKREEDYKIADVMSKEEVPGMKKLEAEDIEKMSDSNADIKGRLSETVRDNAKHLLDPDRKVNGQAVPAQQPLLFTGGVMRSYQIEGVEWLRMLWENGINGILADEMGLGKTIQCIAHVAMMLERKVMGPFLVVAPLSTLPNWINEFKRFTPEVSVQIKNLNCRLVRELKMLPTDNKLLLTGTPLQNNLAELWSLLNFLLPEVFDDLKSFESWFDIDTIGSDAKNVVANEREQNILHMLHQSINLFFHLQILTPFLLRRLKSDVTLEVPPKKEIVVYAPLTVKQESFYTAVVNKTIAKVLGQVEAPVVLTTDGRPKRRTRRPVDYKETDGDTPYDLEKYLERVQKEADPAPVVDVQMPLDSQINLKLQNILMLLKRCCNHPYLIEYPLDPATQEFKIDEQLVQTSGKFLILDRMLPELKKRGHKVLIFSQMTSILDILMDYCYLRGYQYSRLDGSMAYPDREENMTKFSSDPEVFLFLLSTRAGGLGINLTAADTVIIFDSDWNPQADLQAQDRCHRIGQTKPVVVYRLVTANTIDQKILERASAKRKLEKMVIHKKKFKGGKAELKQTKSCVDVSELMDLLNTRDYEKEVKSTKGKVISDKDLEALLDRSDLLDKAKRSSKQKVGVFKVIEAKESSEISLT
uniref:Helicase, lymphoid specific n=1 Tax=Oncorhynchus tshawytscha TaxID=74940 RepID=A0A8C8D2N7_ONCTS